MKNIRKLLMVALMSTALLTTTNKAEAYTWEEVGYYFFNYLQYFYYENEIADPSQTAASLEVYSPLLAAYAYYQLVAEDQYNFYYGLAQTLYMYYVWYGYYTGAFYSSNPSFQSDIVAYYEQYATDQEDYYNSYADFARNYYETIAEYYYNLVFPK